MRNHESSSLAGLRILVVEDNLLVANEIEHLVTKLGCRVVGPVPRCAEAMAAIERDALDGALLDVNLNGESGLTIADELFKRGVPFIFMTGYDSIHLPLEHRVFACIQKPFTADQLERMMEKTFADAAMHHESTS